MALSSAARRRIEVAVAHRAVGKEISDAIDTATGTPAAAVADVAVVDATDLESAQDLANANKAKINELLASLRTAGFLAT